MGTQCAELLRERRLPWRCVFPSIDLECGPPVWVPTSQTGDSEVRGAGGGAGGGKGVLTAGATLYRSIYRGKREWDIWGEDVM